MLLLVKIAKINNILLLAIIIVNLYVILTPIVPAVLFTLQSHTSRRQKLAQTIHPAKPSPTAPAPSVSLPNHIVIPAMLLDQPVLEGADTYAILNHGIWRWPAGSTPDKGGNTVLIGHRFTYTIPKGVFYYLDKLHVGDELGLTWNNKLYDYKVSTIQIVTPTQTSIENATPDARLTLFTCTPIAWPTNRLVVIAKLETINGVSQ